MNPLKRILIIEDDDALVRVLTDCFVARGYDVIVATEGDQAMQTAASESFDMILLDIMLPNRNGFEICQSIRKAGIETPIVMLTAKDHEDDIIRGLDLGADDYVTKPFSIRELVARVGALSRRTSTPDETIVRFGDCQLDLDAHVLQRAGQAVELTTKEFGLLALFVNRPGRALTRGEILNQVWGNNVIVTTRSVDRCITTLRAKIEEDPRNPRWIITIRDIGYRFDLSGQGAAL